MFGNHILKFEKKSLLEEVLFKQPKTNLITTFMNFTIYFMSIIKISNVPWDIAKKLAR